MPENSIPLDVHSSRITVHEEHRVTLNPGTGETREARQSDVLGFPQRNAYPFPFELGEEPINLDLRVDIAEVNLAREAARKHLDLRALLFVEAAIYGTLPTKWI